MELGDELRFRPGVWGVFQIMVPKIADRLGDNVIKDFKVAKEGEFFPSEKPNYNASLVVLTPNETSTGVQIPNEYLENAWKARGEDTLIAWDCTSCAGGRELPKGQFDVMLFPCKNVLAWAAGAV